MNALHGIPAWIGKAVLVNRTKSEVLKSNQYSQVFTIMSKTRVLTGDKKTNNKCPLNIN